MLLLLVHDKRMRIGILKRMVDMQYTVGFSSIFAHLSNPFIVYVDTEKANAGPPDPLAALEKTTDAQTHLTKVQIPRLESLQDASEQHNADPYALSMKVRKRFREEKKIDKAKTAIDDGIRGKYGLPETLALVEEDSDLRDEAKGEWERGQRELEARSSLKRRRLASETTSKSVNTSRLKMPSMPASRTRRIESNKVVSSLRDRIMENTAARTSLPATSETKKMGLSLLSRRK